MASHGARDGLESRHSPSPGRWRQQQQTAQQVQQAALGHSQPDSPGKGGGTTAPAAAQELPVTCECGTPCVPSFLSLPNTTLAHILGCLTSAADLARCAAACCALRDLITSQTWGGVTLLEAHTWGPRVKRGLAWAAGRCPGVAKLDLSGMGACGGEELEELSGLRGVQELTLRDCWRLQGGSVGELQLLRSLPGLTFLDLSGTGALAGGARLFRVLPAGLRELRLAGMRPAGPAADLFPALARLSALSTLDLAGNPWLSSAHLEQLMRLWDANRAQHGGAYAAQGAHNAAPAPRRALALDCWAALRHISFRGCEQLGGLGAFFLRHPGLTHVDVSHTAACDADVELLAESCHQLASLDLSGCMRVKGPALCTLSRAPAVHAGHLHELRMGDLAWVKPQHLAQILGALSEWASGAVSLDLSHCGGLNDSSLHELTPWADTHGAFWLAELKLAGSSRVSAGALRQLALGIVLGEEEEEAGPLSSSAWGGWYHHLLGEAGNPADPVPLPSGSPTCARLAQLHLLDLSHCECFRASTHAGREALAAVFGAAGAALRVLRLDGCHVGGGVLTQLAQACPELEELSVVGCKGAFSADFCALSAALRGLRRLAVGGAVLSWREDAALTGFTGLTSLRIARRSFLSDPQLFPVLASNPSLQEVALASCPTLSDAVLAALPHSVRHLQLVCCERITGSSLRHLRRLRSLRLSGCPGVTEAAMQSVALSCSQLTLLELPGHVRVGCLPVAPQTVATHLRGIRLEGGLAESVSGGVGRRWRGRSGGAGAGRAGG